MRGGLRGSRGALLALVALWIAGARPALAGAARGVDGVEVKVAGPQRVVVLGGGLTELVWALGAGAQVVGVDASSTAPAAAARLPQVGYYRQASAEGVLSLGPTLVIAHEDVGPPALVSQLRQAGVPTLRVEGEASPAALLRRVELLSAALDRPQEGAALRARLVAELGALPPPAGAAPRVLFLYARGGGVLNVAGQNTAAHAMIELAGGQNVFAAQQGYAPLSAEAALAAAPDVLLLTTGGLAALGGLEGLLATPGLGQTPAGRARRVLTVDDLTLLGFGPRAPAAAAALAAQLRAAP